MGDITVRAERRDQLGKNASRRLRARGRIPAVLYGRDLESVALAVDPAELDRILHSETGHNTIFKIEVDGIRNDVLIRDYQLDPLRGVLVHADFQTIVMDKKMAFEVPVQPEGTAAGVKAGGVLEIILREIEVECLPGDVPDHIRCNVEALEVGDNIRVSGLEVDASKVTILSEPELVVITVVPPHKVEEPEEVEALVEGEEPEVIGREREEEEAAGQRREREESGQRE